MIELIDIGLRDYEKARAFQDLLVAKRHKGEILDTLIICQHPPVITLGKRTPKSDLLVSEELLASRGVKLVRTDRGGKATYHGPGQIVIYPVISLRELGIGVKEFVRLGLEVIRNAIADLGLRATSFLEPAGVWIIPDKCKGQADSWDPSMKKIASVGLRIQNGITNHGFSINYDCDLKNFELLNPCGLVGVSICSVVTSNPSTMHSSRQSLISAIYDGFRLSMILAK